MTNMFCHLCEKKSDYLVCLVDIDKTQAFVHGDCAVYVAGDDWKQYSKGYFEIDSDGTKRWYLNGKLHRLDGPAVEYASGTKKWYLNDELHRLDGPAIEYIDGTKCWYLNDKRHRLDGPAIEYIDGTKCWYLNDKRHRLDGPAIEYSDGGKYWYLNDKKLSELEFNKQVS